MLHACDRIENEAQTFHVGSSQIFAFTVAVPQPGNQSDQTFRACFSLVPPARRSCDAVTPRQIPRGYKPAREDEIKQGSPAHGWEARRRDQRSNLVERYPTHTQTRTSLCWSAISRQCQALDTGRDALSLLQTCVATLRLQPPQLITASVPTSHKCQKCVPLASGWSRSQPLSKIM